MCTALEHRVLDPNHAFTAILVWGITMWLKVYQHIILDRIRNGRTARRLYKCGPMYAASQGYSDGKEALPLTKERWTYWREHYIMFGGLPSAMVDITEEDNESQPLSW